MHWGHFCSGDIFAGVIFAGDIFALGTFLHWGHFCTGDIIVGDIFAGDISAGDNSVGTFLWGHFVAEPLESMLFTLLAAVKTKLIIRVIPNQYLMVV